MNKKTENKCEDLGFNLKSKIGKLRPSGTDVKLWIAYAYHLEGYIEGILEGLKYYSDGKERKE